MIIELQQENRKMQLSHSIWLRASIWSLIYFEAEKKSSHLFLSDSGSLLLAEGTNASRLSRKLCFTLFLAKITSFYSLLESLFTRPRSFVNFIAEWEVPFMSTKRSKLKMVSKQQSELNSISIKAKSDKLREFHSSPWQEMTIKYFIICHKNARRRW